MLSLSSWGLLAHVIGYVPLYNPLLRVTYISKVRVHMRQNTQFLSSETGPLHLIEPFVFPPIFLQISFFLNSQTKFHYETRHIVIIQSSVRGHAAGSFLPLWITQLLHEEMRLRLLGAGPAVAELDHTVLLFLVLQGIFALISIGLHSLTVSPTVKGSSLPTNLEAFVAVYFLDDGHSDWGEMGTPVVWILLSLVVKDVEFKNKNNWLFVSSLRTDWQSYAWVLISVDLYALEIDLWAVWQLPLLSRNFLISYGSVY